jgi:flagellar hook-basal body complex protein FliE
MRTERADITQVLEQMRALRSQVQTQAPNAGGLAGLDHAGGIGAVGGIGSVGGADRVDFSKLFQTAIGQVNGLQKNANSLAQAYETGAPGVDITQVMIASQKASVSFQAAVQVRNKLLSAYQDIMNMPI